MNQSFYDGFEKRAFNPVGFLRGAVKSLGSSSVGQYAKKQMGAFNQSGAGKWLGQKSQAFSGSDTGKWIKGQTDQLKDVVKKNPWKSLGAAAGTGYVASKVMSPKPPQTQMINYNS
jgi:ElaB/YqjD/DUF883 family membrane-anchored ribosome-binding protein